jgi:hypothetical protein
VLFPEFGIELIESGILTADESCDDRKVNAAISEILESWRREQRAKR